MTIKHSKEIISNVSNVSRFVLLCASLSTLVYFTWWLNFQNVQNVFLYALLFIGEIYHVIQIFGFIYSIWDQQEIPRFAPTDFAPKVDVFITVAGEPIEIVKRTVVAALNMDYSNHKVYILNDGYVLKKDNWKEIDDLKKEFPIKVITRKNPGGAKAGNVNNAFNKTKAPFFALFDADQVPEPDFLKRTIGFFKEDELALVQTPQYYENKEENYLSNAAWEQQELFFGPICRGKNIMNATFWCGTNAVIRREALESVGGVCEDNIAEDFLTTMFMHQKGWKTMYLPRILAKGLAPLDLDSYVSQQFRWARGSLEVIFKYNPLFNKDLTWGQRFQYLYSSGYYLSGLIILIDALLPVISLATGLYPIADTSTNFIIYFFPFMFFTLYLLMSATHHTVTFTAIQLSVSSFFIFLQATFSTIFNKKVRFVVTSKQAQEGNFLKFLIPHVSYMVLGLIAFYIGYRREGLQPEIITNFSWVIFNSVFFMGFVIPAYQWNTLPAKVQSQASILLKNVYYLGIKKPLTAISFEQLSSTISKIPAMNTKDD